MSLFIPPEGAMQFEVTCGWNGEPVPEHMVPLVLWVQPLPKKIVEIVHSKNHDCPHSRDQLFLMIHHPFFKVHNNGHVCPCVGRIIE